MNISKRFFADEIVMLQEGATLLTVMSDYSLLLSLHVASLQVVFVLAPYLALPSNSTSTALGDCILVANKDVKADSKIRR